jgi:L-lactate dehydrogenase complex protein LldG
MDGDSGFAAGGAREFSRMVEEPTMSERGKILARIREALHPVGGGDVQARVGDALHSGVPVGQPELSGTTRGGQVKDVLPSVGGSFEERLIQFQTEAVELRTDFRLLKNGAELVRAVQALKERESWTKIASHRGEMTEWVTQALGLPVVWSEGKHDVHELESCAAGITECDCLVAQTGSVVLTSRSAGGRGISILPPHHVVLARRAQLVGGMPEAFELLRAKYGASYPSMISFVTGPSRTGDIERILVLGAHGPRRLTVVMT